MMDKNSNLLIKIIVFLGVLFVLIITITTINYINKFNNKISKDIAYEYIDAVESMMIRQIMYGQNFNGTYKILENGNMDSYEISIRNDSKPTGGFLTITNNKVIEGCLDINNNKVEIKNYKVDSVKKGKCE